MVSTDIKLSHAYIVAGPVAEKIAMAAVCSGHGEKPCLTCPGCSKASRRIHPDIFYVDKPPDKREILIGQIRWLKKDVIVIPVEAEKKVYIINEAELMNTAAQNAFLQMLEEPPSHAVFILRTDNPAQLLPTVRSRCVSLRSGVEKTSADAGPDEMVMAFFSSLEEGNAKFTEFMFRTEKLEKNAFVEFVESARAQIPEYLTASYDGRYKVPGAVLSRAERILARAAEMADLNINTGHIAGLIFASLLNIDNNET